MNAATPAMQNLARRLIASEAARNPFDGAVGAMRACDKLRAQLAKLAGAAGFRSLLARAVALAIAEAPWLESVRVDADGALEGFEAASAPQSAAQREAGGAAVVAQLLGLLVTFIGEPLTLRLVGDAWPETNLGESGSTAKVQP
jgi:hypothetical protein